MKIINEKFFILSPNSRGWTNARLVTYTSQ